MSLVRRPSLGFLALLVLAAVAAPLLAPHDPTEMNKKATLALPSGSNPLGTDQFGRDILSRLLYGARIALAIGIGATLAAALVGVPLGLWAGWQGGVVDGVAMRGVDTLLAIPPVLLAMGLVAMTGPGSLNAGIAVSVVGLPQFARLARAGTLGQKRMEYAEASVALGATDRRILFRAILPEASLSFLGLGTQPPAPSWGLMVSESRNYMYAAPWYGMMPGVLIAATVLALNAASDLVRARRRG